MRKHDTLQKKRDSHDDKVLLRTSFQWLYAVILLLYGFVFMFTVIFRVSSFYVNNQYGMKNAAVLVSSVGYSPEPGDRITVSDGYSAFLGQVAAFSGETVSVGSDKNSFANCITYQNKNYFSSEELQTVLKDMKIPEDHILVTGISSENGYFRVGEIISTKQVIGRAECFVYPFSMLGKPVSQLSEVH